MRIAPLAVEHIHEYRCLMLYAYEQAADAFTSTPEERAIQSDSWWLKRMADPSGEGIAFGAFHNGKIVGTVALEFSVRTKTKHKVHLVGMFVLEEKRGQGIGKGLLEAAVECARCRPTVRVMTLTVTQGNDSALGLYQASGFKQFGVEPMAILTPSGYKSKVHMWRSVNDNSAA